MEKLKPDKHDADSLSRQTTTAEGQVGQLEKKFSKLTMTGMAFAILKYINTHTTLNIQPSRQVLIKRTSTNLN